MNYLMDAIMDDLMELDDDFWSYPDDMTTENDFIDFILTEKKEQEIHSPYQLFDFNLKCREKL